MNSDIKKVLDRVKQAQSQVQTLVKDRAWVASAKKYAERQSKEVKKIINSDVAKVKTFLNREKKELERLQKKIPGEVDKIKTFVESQKQELQTLLVMAKKEAEGRAKKVKAVAQKKMGAIGKKTAPKKTAGAKKKATVAKKKVAKKKAATAAKA